MKTLQLQELKNCNFCPRNCNIDRFATLKGYCKTYAGYYIASIVVHKGEEPPISGNKGICNVFFAHCNLQCVYCQNHQISRNNIPLQNFEMTLEEVLDKIIAILDTGINIVGFVSPSHFVLQVIEIIKGLYRRGYFPITVYNTNAYDKVETLQLLENYIDVYLPDLKYVDNHLAAKYSKAFNYPEVAKAAIKEMFRQKGSEVVINKDGYAESGLIIRHLVLPNHTENSKQVLRFIAKELSPDVHISLMSQYYPTADAFKFKELSRPITPEEYETVLTEMEKLGLKNGWIQELDSSENYRPDFNFEHPFEY